MTCMPPRSLRPLWPAQATHPRLCVLLRLPWSSLHTGDTRPPAHTALLPSYAYAPHTSRHRSLHRFLPKEGTSLARGARVVSTQLKCGGPGLDHLLPLVVAASFWELVSQGS